MMTRCLQHARMEVHYETNGAFMEDGQLLKPENIAKIAHIPCQSCASTALGSCEFPLLTEIRQHSARPIRCRVPTENCLGSA